MRLSSYVSRSVHLHSILLLLVAGNVWADQWYLEPQASLRGFYSDNVALSAESPIGSAGSVLRGTVKAGTRTQTSDLGIQSAVVRRQYFSDPKRDTTEFSLKAVGAYRLQRDRFQLSAGVNRDSTLTSELSTSGRVQQAKRRIQRRVAPSWRHQVTQLLSVDANASYQDVAYQDAAATGLVDYTYGNLGFGADYRLSQRTLLMGRLSFSRYEAEQTLNESETLGVRVGAGYEISPTWSMSALLGMRRTDSTNRTESRTSTGSLAYISTTKRFQTGELAIGLDRSLTPSGSGQLETQHASIDWSQRLKPRLRWGIAIDTYQNDQSASAAGTDRRTYVSLTPDMRYSLDREWSIVAGYRHRYQAYDDSRDSASANEVFFTLSYSPLSKR